MSNELLNSVLAEFELAVATPSAQKLVPDIHAKNELILAALKSHKAAMEAKPVGLKTVPTEASTEMAAAAFDKTDGMIGLLFASRVYRIMVDAAPVHATPPIGMREAALGREIPAGYKLAPIQPTEAMIAAGIEAPEPDGEAFLCVWRKDVEKVYRAMLNAASDTQKDVVGDGEIE